MNRPSGLGLGAKVVCQSRVKYLSEPVERKLRAKLEAGKRKAAKSIEECSATNDVDHEDSDEELESRTNGFTKKIKGTPPSSSLQMKHPEQVHQEKMKESEYSSPGESESQLHKREINAAPDRYGIKPGRHYYGVDRSSVFEKKMFYMLNEKRAATGKEAYFWSVSDT